MFRYLFFIYFLSISGFLNAQQNTDSIYFEEKTREYEQKLKSLDDQLESLQDYIYRQDKLNENLRNEIESFELESKKTDSLHEKGIKIVSAKNDNLKNQLDLNKSDQEQKNEFFEDELYKARKGAAVVTIVLFSIIIFLFLFIYYRNYKMELFINRKLMNEAINRGEEIEKLDSRLNRKLEKKSRKAEKRLEKEIKKRERKMKGKLKRYKKK